MEGVDSNPIVEQTTDGKQPDTTVNNTTTSTTTGPRKGWANIKKEFLIPTNENPLKRNISEVSGNKGEQDKMCISINLGKPCTYGDKCKYSHDVSKFLEKKSEIIPGKCVHFEREGKCKFGISCLVGQDHIVDGKSIEDPEKVASYKPVKLVCNDISTPIIVSLKKREYLFPRAMEYIKQNNIPIKQHYKAKQFQKNLSSTTTTTTTETTNVEQKADNTTTTTDTNTEPTVTKEEIIVDTKTETTDSNNNNNNQSHENTEIDKIEIPLKAKEKKRINFKDQLYLAPLTTVGNLPFRRICKKLGVDITCGEMALASQIVEGNKSELALLKRHSSEDKFGVQICGSYVDSMILASEFIENECDVDFVDINSGCPIDLICNMGAGSALMEAPRKMENMLRGCSSILSCPLTIKLRIGKTEEKPNAHNLIPQLGKWGAAAVTLHGRSRNQRYHRLANWDYINQCASASDIPLIANGDIYNFQDVVKYYDASNVDGATPSKISSYMIARGSLIKPWIFTEIKERREWDISASERLDLVKEYVNYGLDHWGSDQMGVDNTRKFLLNWLSFTHRYVPIGILETQQKMNEKPPPFYGRSDLETLLASNQVSDWIKISEMFLGKVGNNFTFVPKHNSNSYESQG
ncbi:CCCH-type zinc finger-containing protein [Tieghemostelium lacteum]|uniref:tRNA-dihydrouridine(47) synthase [NAD(P)(+)] n=1 Tax=Tieghemostelium lacteum TaxID=361077 RepID=A0A151ZEX5_TIELA|nr:CCCH-type zinc finger-containing protein [Tieghemostelium lacteum]|eukprot:KYQ92511.1 CCCH-type zinc finger-containing protein [Tieghemostelium lacteum]